MAFWTSRPSFTPAPQTPAGGESAFVVVGQRDTADKYPAVTFDRWRELTGFDRNSKVSGAISRLTDKPGEADP
jgi:hypothetical protein